MLMKMKSNLLKSKLLIILLISVIILPLFNSVNTGSSRGDVNHYQEMEISSDESHPGDDLTDYLIYFDQTPPDLSGPDIVVVEKYDSFIHVKISQNEVNNLVDSGYIVQPLVYLDWLRFGQTELDVSKLDDGLTGYFGDKWKYQSFQDAYYIIKFKGPIKNSWLDSLTRMGVEFLKTPADYYAHVVKIPMKILPEVRAKEFVSWVDIYHPALRLRGGLEFEENLFYSNASLNVEIIFFRNIGETGFFNHLTELVLLGGSISRLVEVRPDRA